VLGAAALAFVYHGRAGIRHGMEYIRAAGDPVLGIACHTFIKLIFANGARAR
jgi:hypothetical protein